ncbi:hypothetical protein GCM10027258_63120 [Amycolatopsis stemonae]
MTDQPTTTPAPASPPATAPDSPALRLAERIIALGRHLRHNSTLPNVDVNGRPYIDGFQLDLVVSTHWFQDEPRGAAAVLAWAATLADAVIELSPCARAGETRVAALGGIDKFRVRVWHTETGDLHAWLNDGKPVIIPLEQLTAYVTAGSTKDIEVTNR